MMATMYNAQLGVEKYQEALKVIWNSDLGTETGTNTWNSIWRNRILKSMSVRIKENYYKVIWKWYLTLVKLNIIDSS